MEKQIIRILISKLNIYSLIVNGMNVKFFKLPESTITEINGMINPSPTASKKDPINIKKINK